MAYQIEWKTYIESFKSAIIIFPFMYISWISLKVYLLL